MSEQISMQRRTFLKTVAGGGLALAAAGGVRGEDAAPAARPKLEHRPLGKTGVQVPILSLGGMFDITDNQMVLRAAYEHGVHYWDTADCYNNSKSEYGIGMFFEKYPERRKEIFLASKSDKRDPAGLSELLNRSLERMKTDHIDLYYVHGIGGIGELNDETRKWAEKAKKDGKIRLFGFTTHKNMEDCLLPAADLGYIDAIMVKYNFRNMHTDAMKRAFDACAKAGIGLVAMKTQANGPVKMDSEASMKLATSLLEKGFTEGQAKLKVVWEMPNVAAICSQMPNLNILMTNIAAARNEVKLSAIEHDLFRQLAAETCSGFCAGCAQHCEHLAGGVPVSDVMRGLMYERAYGDVALARETLGALTPEQRDGLASIDFAAAERACPHGLAIGSLMREAAQSWA